MKEKLKPATEKTAQQVVHDLNLDLEAICGGNKEIANYFSCLIRLVAARTYEISEKKVTIFPKGVGDPPLKIVFHTGNPDQGDIEMILKNTNEGK